MSNHFFDFTLDDAENAIDFISPDLPQKEWMNIAQSLQNEFGDSAFDIFDKWSSFGGSYKATTTKSLWNSPAVKAASQVKISTLIYHATKGPFVTGNGWSSKNKTKLSEEERNQRNNERDQRNEERRIQFEKLSSQKLAHSAAWYSKLSALKPSKKPAPYQVEKGHENALSIHEFKEFHSHKKHLMVLPLRDIDNNWRGCELVYAWRKFRDSKTGKQRTFKRLFTGSDPKTGFHAFPNHNALATAKRIFVCGGWSDGLWAHKATGDVSVYVVGETNIPGIVNQLSDKFPNAKVICAPDNDQAGLAAIEQSNSLWTHPVNANDWSDVANDETIESLTAQLNNVRGFEYVNVNERYLSMDIKPGLNLVLSAKETGKSTDIINFLNDNPTLSALVVSYRTLLVKDLSERAGFTSYDDVISKDDPDANILRTTPRLAITEDSLRRLVHQNELRSYDVVFIDESDQGLQHFDAATMAHREYNLSILARLLKTAKYQILADADLSHLTTGFCKRIGLDSGRFVTNEFKPRQDSTLNMFEDENHLRGEFIKRAHHEPVFFCSNSIIRIKQVQRMLLESGINENTVIAVHGENSGDEVTQKFIKNINEDVKDLFVLMASPSLGTGVSINIGHPFVATYAEFTSRSGTAEQAHQQLARVRGITEYNVWCDPAIRNLETNPDELSRVMLDKPEKDEIQLLQFDHNKGGHVVKDELFEWLHCEVKAIKNRNLNAFREIFVSQAKAEGYTLKEIVINKLMAEQTKVQIEQIKVDLDDESRERFFDQVNHPRLTDEQMKEADRGEGNFSKESYTKSIIYRDMNLSSYGETNELSEDDVEDLACELAYLESGDKYVSSLKKLSYIALSKDAVTKLDANNRKFAQSRASLKHYSMIRKHELRLFKAVGLDEHLNSEGKHWQGKKIASNIRNYLEKHKDDFAAYSGANITWKTLKNPVRWFHDHLKSLSVPIKSYRKKVNGKSEWFYCVDDVRLERVKSLVMCRVEGIESHLANDDKSTSDKVTSAQLVINNINGSNVTAKTYENINENNDLTVLESGRGEDEISFGALVLTNEYKISDLVRTSIRDHLKLLIDDSSFSESDLEAVYTSFVGNWLNNYDISSLRSSFDETDDLAGYMNRVIAGEWPNDTKTIVRSVANSLEIGQVAIWSALSDFDIAEISSGDFTKDELFAYVEGIKNKKMTA